MASMGSAGGEEMSELVSRIDVGTHKGIGEAESHAAEIREGDTGVNRGDSGLQNSSGVPQQGAGESSETELDARQEKVDAVFEVTEGELEKYDEAVHVLAERYRDDEKRRQEAAKARCKDNRNATYIAVDCDIDTNDGKPSCYVEIRNLVLIENSTIHKKALEEWARKEKLFASRVERRSTKVGSLKNEVYQLIGFFSVFQGVLFTAVAQANLLHCHNLWSPVLLSMLASIVTIAGVCQKLFQISSLEVTIYSEEQALKDVVHRGRDLRREGKNFVFAKFSGNKKKGLKQGYFGWYATGTVGILVVFMIAFPLSHRSILCNS